MYTDVNESRYDVHYDESFYTGIKYEEALSSKKGREMMLQSMLKREEGEPKYVLNDSAATILDNLTKCGLHHTFRSTQGAFYVGERGDILTTKEFFNAYGDMLWYNKMVGYDSKGAPKMKAVQFDPMQGHDSYVERTVAEENPLDGYHPLYVYNYFLPYRYYDGYSYNDAQPYSIFMSEKVENNYNGFYELMNEYLDNVFGVEVVPWVKKWLLLKFLHPEQHIGIAVSIYGAQGTGKSTFLEICKMYMNAINIETDAKIDLGKTFNADWATKVVVGIEEQDRQERNDSMNKIKDAVTNPSVIMERKFCDPVVLKKKFDLVFISNGTSLQIVGQEQRRFIMGLSNSKFTKYKNDRAAKTFKALYGENGVLDKKDRDKALADYMRRLYEDPEIRGLDIYDVPRNTPAEIMSSEYTKSDEQDRIEFILAGIAPLIKHSLEKGEAIETMTKDDGSAILLEDYMPTGSFLWKKGKLYVRMPSWYLQYNQASDPDRVKPIRNALLKQRLFELTRPMEEKYGIIYNPVNDTAKFPGCHFNCKPSILYPALVFELSPPPPPPVVEDKPIVVKKKPEKKGPTIIDGPRYSLYGADKDGEYEVVNPVDGFRSVATVTSMANMIFEDDHSSLELQEKEAERLANEGVINRIVFSGGRSLHLRITLSDPPDTHEQYKYVYAYLVSTLSNLLTFDITCSDPCRLSRYPYELKVDKDGCSTKDNHWRVDKETGNWMTVPGKVSQDGKTVWEHLPQCVLYRSDNILDLKWREGYKMWKALPRKDNTRKSFKYPAKQIYMDALEDLFDYTFFSDEKYNGHRQELFLPTYQLARFTGYSHKEIENVVVQGMQIAKYHDTQHFTTFCKNLEKKDIGREYFCL